MFQFLAKLGLKPLLDKYLKQALILAVNEIYDHREDIKAALNEQIDKLAESTKTKLIEKANSK